MTVSYAALPFLLTKPLQYPSNGHQPLVQLKTGGPSSRSPCSLQPPLRFFKHGSVASAGLRIVQSLSRRRWCLPSFSPRCPRKSRSTLRSVRPPVGALPHAIHIGEVLFPLRLRRAPARTRCATLSLQLSPIPNRGPPLNKVPFGVNSFP